MLDELKRQLIKKLISKYISQLVWTDVTQAVVATSPEDKNKIVVALQGENPQEAGRILGNMVYLALQAKATTEVELMFADNTLDLTELQYIFE